MTDYASVPEANKLVIQRNSLEVAINQLRSGGAVSSFTVAPAPPEPGTVPGPIVTPSFISAPAPTPKDASDALITWMIAQQAAIDDQLAALGVTNTPPAAT